MEEKIKIMIVPSLNGEWEARRLGEKLVGLGYEINFIKGAFGEIVGLKVLSQGDYLIWKPDLIVAIGVGCITVGTFVKAMRIMINPDFHYSDFLKEWVNDRKKRIESGVYDDDQRLEVERDCKDAEYDAVIAETLESKAKSLRGEKPMLGIFTHESDDMADYKERYGDYETHLSIDLHNNDSLNILVSRIDQFLKDNLHK